MPDNKLVDYITQSRKLDVPDGVTKERLLQVGWPYDKIVDAFNYLDSQHEEILLSSTKSLSRLAVFALLVSFIIPPLGMALAFFASTRLRRDSLKSGQEFVTASYIVGIIGTLSLGYLLISQGGITGLVSKGCPGCLIKKDNQLSITLNNDFAQPIRITGAMLDCDGARIQSGFPFDVGVGEPFTIEFLCPGTYSTIYLSYEMDGKKRTFSSRI